MIDVKPRIFIGSSTEGLPIAQEIVNNMSDVADCKIWTGQFEFGNSAYEDLVKQLSLFDYGILVATGDDTTFSRKVKKFSPRDNVIFEFGLFAGRLGRQRAFLMAEAGIKIPSDLNGITLPFFPTTKKTFRTIFSATTPEKQKEAIIDNCKRIKQHINNRRMVFDFGFLPSTSLAYGYYNNFILKAITNLTEVKKLKIGNTCEFPRQCQKEDSTNSTKPQVLNGMPFDDVFLSVLIPESLSSDMFDHVKAQRQKTNWKLIKIDAGSYRPFDFYIEADKSSGGTLQLSDVPLTLNALNASIKAYVGKTYIGFAGADELLEKREINLFKGVLDYLIAENPITKNRVKTELVAK